MNKGNSLLKFFERDSGKVAILSVFCIIAHYVFIFQRGLVFEDWMMLGLTQKLAAENRFPMAVLLDPLRFFGHTYNCLISYLFRYNPTLYHFQLLFYDILATVLVFTLSKRIFRNSLTAFLATLIFSIFPNNTESHLSVNTSFMKMGFCVNMMLLIFLADWISKKKGKIALSVISLIYFLSLFIYEQGAMLPFVFLAMNYLLLKDIYISERKRIFTFILISSILLISAFVIKKTNFLGLLQPIYGGEAWKVDYKFNIDGLFNFLDIVFYTNYLGVFIMQMKSVYFGLKSMNRLILLLLLMIDIFICYILFKMKLIKEEGIAYGKNYLYAGLWTMLLFIMPVFMYPFFSSRHTAYLNIGFCIILIYLIYHIEIKDLYKRLLLSAFIFMCLLYNQGESYNWVIAGRLNMGLFEYVCIKKDEIISRKPKAVVIYAGNQYIRSGLGDRYPSHIGNTVLNGAGYGKVHVGKEIINMSPWVYITWMALKTNEMLVISESRQPMHISNNMISYYDYESKSYKQIGLNEVYVINMSYIVEKELPHLFSRMEENFGKKQDLKKEDNPGKPGDFYKPAF
ncbi:MAG: hypothetical protein JXA60_04290 [Candidatus Coatesbacteria bacterium]|nr:hypothetical protein [Candidatus Coatesbacteria bacterium]